MGILHRLFGRLSAEVWQVETRLMHQLGAVQLPQAVQWISTSACDLRCPHCYSNAGRRAAGELTTQEACSLIIDELVMLGRPTFVIAGGEALLRDDFAQIVAYAHERGVPWALHSHGGKVSHLGNVFAQHTPVMAAVSLDGPQAYHDRFRGRPGSFAAACEAIRALKNAGCPEVVAGTTITRENADLVMDLLPIILECGADSWGLHLMTPEGRAAKHRELLATPAQLRRVAAFARRQRAVMRIELDNEWGGAGAADCFYRDDAFHCGAGRISCVISATGEAMPCTTTDPSMSAGNIRDRSLRQIWADGFGAFRSGADPVKSDCGDCWLQTRHGNSCRQSAFHSDALSVLPGDPVPLQMAGIPGRS
jgi:radical SAM protein with 4Fe4S-binding SPASM domain